MCPEPCGGVPVKALAENLMLVNCDPLNSS